MSNLTDLSHQLETMRIPNGELTIENTATGEHRTFRIKRQKDDSRFAPGQRIVQLLTGSDNTGDYQTFAFLIDDKPDARQGMPIFRKKRAQSEKWAQYATALWSLAIMGEASPYTAKGYTLHVSRHCIRCNRLLTTPESIERGIGPECATRL